MTINVQLKDDWLLYMFLLGIGSWMGLRVIPMERWGLSRLASLKARLKAGTHSLSPERSFRVRFYFCTKV